MKYCKNLSICTSTSSLDFDLWKWLSRCSEILKFIKQKNQIIYLEIEVTLKSKKRVACINIYKKEKGREEERKRGKEDIWIINND